MQNLENKIKRRELKMAVVGLGYVGLPLLLLLNKLGFTAIGIDKNIEKISQLRSGKLNFLQNSKPAKKLLGQYLRYNKPNISSNFSLIKDADIIFVCVDTPIDKYRKPDNTNISRASKGIAKHIKKNAILVIESTLAPKTTHNVIIPTIEKISNFKINQDFYVAVCSERIRPNQDVFKDLSKFPRVLGTSSSKINSLVKSVYKLITRGQIDVVDIVTAEIVKTAENALRDVKIAFSNEVSLICDQLGTNIWDVVDLVNRRYGYAEMLQPGIGVGGHCLPKDPWLLISPTKHLKTKIIKEARSTNSYMSLYTAKLIKDSLKKNGVKYKNAKVLILGYSYIENCEDTRNSSSIDLIDNLKKVGVRKISVHDPLVSGFNNDPYTEAQSADCLVLAVKHNQFKNLDLKKFKKVVRTPVIFDCKNFFEKEKCQDLGFNYYALGAL